jgi:3-dehydroquinate synthase
MKKVVVELGSREYDILIGRDIVSYLSNFLAEKKYSKIFIISDENVAKPHLEKIVEVVGSCEKIIIPAGEQTKSFGFLEKICEEILSKGLDRKSLIIAFGGGVVGDLSGFIAAILLRGIDFVQIPTTLLAMVDSSVGGKTAINSKFGKNLIGSFYQPKLVICDISFLKTLPSRQIKSGYGEVVKYGLIRDKNFFEFLENNFSKLFKLDEDFLIEIITRSCEIKAEIVAGDEREAQDRALLNFGHSFAHVFEVETNYSNELMHGEAVALGMVMAAKMSLNFAMISNEDFARIKKHFQDFGFVIDAAKIRSNWDMPRLVGHLYKDKKNDNGKLNFVLLEKIGGAVVKKGVELGEFLRVF